MSAFLLLSDVFLSCLVLYFVPFSVDDSDEDKKSHREPQTATDISSTNSYAITVLLLRNVKSDIRVSPSRLSQH